ncbi:MAG: hypothetical protein WAN43_19350 [Rhodomicrobium sp.]|jgi:hypothetical protein
MIERHYGFRQLSLSVSGALAGLASLAALTGPAGAQEPPFRGVPIVIAPLPAPSAPATILPLPALSLQPTLTAPPSARLPEPPEAAKLPQATAVPAQSR